MSAPTVLLIDADKNFALQMAKQCQALNWKLEVCTDGRQAVETALSLNPNAVVLNADLPYMSGYSVCNKIKRNDMLKKLPLVLLSKTADEKTFTQHKKLRTRADEYFSGSYDASAILSKIRPHLKASFPPTPSAQQASGRPIESTQPMSSPASGSASSSSGSSFSERSYSQSSSGTEKKGGMTLLLLALGILFFIVFSIYVFLV